MEKSSEKESWKIEKPASEQRKKGGRRRRKKKEEENALQLRRPFLVSLRHPRFRLNRRGEYTWSNFSNDLPLYSFNSRQIGKPVLAISPC